MPGKPGTPGGPGEGVTIVTNNDGVWVVQPDGTWVKINGDNGEAGAKGDKGDTGFKSESQAGKDGEP
ncbi:hypothetical protein ABS241_19955, partial [Acinetobacter baumannii]|uniref:hypothetical protein n=1 Tax=Acinetobacter baumannii TaxID=470 RepID=UPI003334A5E3